MKINAVLLKVTKNEFKTQSGETIEYGRAHCYVNKEVGEFRIRQDALSSIKEVDKPTNVQLELELFVRKNQFEYQVTGYTVQ